MKTKHENWKYEFTADRAWGAWAAMTSLVRFSTLSKYTGISILADGKLSTKKQTPIRIKRNMLKIYL